MVNSLTTIPSIRSPGHSSRALAHGRLGGVLGVVAVIAVACGSSTPAKLNVIPVERAIERSILKERGITTVVRCPAGAPLKTGYRFRCSAALDVGSYAVDGVELNAKGGVS